MDDLSYNSLYKKYGLLLGIFASVFGIIILTALSNAVILSAALIGIEVKSYTKFILGIIIRIISMVFLLTFARNLEIVDLMGFGFKNFGKAICYSFIGYAFALGFLIDVVTVNLALNNELDFVSMFWCFVFCLMIGLFEETLSRGITMTLIKGTIENKFLVIIVQALIFMLLHLANFFSGALELRAQVTQLIIAFVAGVYYGFVYEKTGSLFGAVLLHAFYDFGVSSPEIFRPTGEYGVIYSNVGSSVLIFAGLFLMLFLAIGLLVRSIKEMIYYKENYEENYEWNVARFNVPFSCKNSNKVIKNLTFSILIFKEKMYEKENILEMPKTLIKPSKIKPLENPIFLDYSRTFLYNYHVNLDYKERQFMRNNINYGSKFKCYLSKVKFLIGTLVFFALTLAAFSLAFPILWANIIKSLTGAVTEDGYSVFLKYLIIYIALEFAEGITSLIKNYIYSCMEDKVTKEIKRDMFNKVVSLEVKAFDRNKVSYFTQKITEEPHNLVASFYKLISLVVTVLKTLCVIVIAFGTCFDCGLVFSFALLVIYLTISNVKPFLAKGERQLNLEVKEYSNSLFNTIRNIREIKMLGAKEVAKKEFDSDSTDIEKEISGSRNMNNLMDLLLFAIKFSIHALVLIITTRQYFAGLVEFETIIFLELYAALLFNGARQIAEANNVWMLYKNSLKAIFDVITNKNYNNEKFGMIEESKGEGDLIVKNVSFELGNGRMILDDINFDVLRNSKVAITDKGGNIKQILLKLLTRQYEPSEGRIMIDNVNIKDFSESALRRTIMTVSEKTFILNDTLENNIRIVKPNATLEEIAEACSKAGVLKWFDNDTLGEVMNVRLGEGGYPLTDVQKELISIARVFLACPKIVIVEDSQTDVSSDDTFSLKNAIDKITDSTLLVFSDMISSISVCDEIVSLSVSKYGSATVEQDYIKERNFYGFLQSKKKMNRVYNEEESVYHKPIEKKSQDDNTIEEIQKLNAQKGAYNNEEHRIFSQIWGDIH